MNELVYIVLTTFSISLLAFIGIFTLSLKEHLLNKILLILVSLSAGALLGGAFLHLIPEAVEKAGNTEVIAYVLVGFVLFFVIEKGLHWRHCHKGRCDVHVFHYMNLIGDAVHNFIDGLIIAASFIVSIPLGLTTAVAIAAHEIPQEIGDFGVLVYGGFAKKKALVLNFIIALTIVLGGIAGYFLASFIEPVVNLLLPFAAGGFIYIAATDLVPEIKKELNVWKSFATLVVLLAGMLLMWVIKLIFSG